ncbi:Squamosa promoter-binding-like protein 15 [Acorus calamus]|uniref:Squamosa promoter-binding-like protein 15 n=1 Tax=Acorus calamus TaxID=4465 RepID=A0AAV9EKS2_ACOCL|nr:Squamosa promoter-binding-like protein 15 [Acorus calamus]
MEGEVGAQVASPIFMHQSLTPPMAKKRDLPWQNPNFQHPPMQPKPGFTGGFHNGNWNSKMWEWNSVMFMARQNPEMVMAAENRKDGSEDDGESLTLRLGVAGGSHNAAEEVVVVRPNKRVRSGSPGGGGGGHPMCQVDNCKADLTGAKDYHRRHKVCEHHSKTTQALVAKQMQRFCQQCSRFHPLSEFDEGKRSCRRRLAGHNRRRRKTQPEDPSSKLLFTGNYESSVNASLDLVNLLTVITRLQGNGSDNRESNGSSLPDKKRLIQFLNKINTLPASANSSAKVPPGNFDLNVSQASQASTDNSCKTSGNPPPPSTMDLLAVLSAATPNALIALSQTSSDRSDDDKTKLNFLHPSSGLNVLEKRSPSPDAERSNGTLQSPVEIVECPPEVRSSLALQLFSSSAEDDSPPKLGSSVKYFSSESSNPMEERSPSSSPPVEQKLFPLHAMSGTARHETASTFKEDNAMVETSTSRGRISSLELFEGSNRRADNGGVKHLRSYPAGYTSSSCSDHSPSSSNSDQQDRTGRIIFKLFDKDPSKFPGTLRTQILDWLSHSPSEIESYIRPGCVILSLYLSMPSLAWDEFQEDLLFRVTSLVKNSDSDFWRSGRFLVQTEKQLASHRDGRIRLCKSWRTWSAPELFSVSPLAVVSGQETSLTLRGCNLTVPGTKIHCTYMGSYISKEILGSAYPGMIYDASSLENFSFPGGPPNVLGRCFVEVENGFKGNSFPIIIADAPICGELWALESEFEEDIRVADEVSEDHVHDGGGPSTREDVLHFLNELGWLFQRNSHQSSPIIPDTPDFSITRFKFLFTFSVERDWSAVVKKLLDLLTERNCGNEGQLNELLEVLLEIQLLSRAVKRKCRKMVDLLLHYSVNEKKGVPKMYLFPPNLAGPGGITPLHLAASTQDSEDMVDALTNDPQEIGLNCWNTILDNNSQSPCTYAKMRNNHSYNRLVARKLVDRRSGQISIMIGNAEITTDPICSPIQVDKHSNTENSNMRSCTQCKVVEMRWTKRVLQGRGLLHRPYMHSMLAVAAVCVCVCLFFRGAPYIGCVDPFRWENLDFGPW